MAQRAAPPRLPQFARYPHLPAIGGGVGDIDTPAVLKVLEPISGARCPRPPTAAGRASRWCSTGPALSYRGGENPAKWRGHLDHILPAPKTLAPTRHHPALPWQQVPAFMDALRAREGLGRVRWNSRS